YDICAERINPKMVKRRCISGLLHFQKSCHSSSAGNTSKIIEVSFMRPSIMLGLVFGIDIGVHYSWLIIAFLIVSPPLLPVLESQQPPEQARQELENRLPRDPRERCSVETRVET